VKKKKDNHWMIGAGIIILLLVFILLIAIDLIKVEGLNTFNENQHECFEWEEEIVCAYGMFEIDECSRTVDEFGWEHFKTKCKYPVLVRSDCLHWKRK